MSRTAPNTDTIFFAAKFIPRVSFTRKFRVAGGWMHPEQFREVRPELPNLIAPMTDLSLVHKTKIPVEASEIS